MKCKYKLFTDSEVFHKEYSSKATLSEMVGMSCQWKEDKNGRIYAGKVRFKLLENYIMCLSLHGYFKSHFPCVMNEKEALWIMKNHPSKKYVKNLKELSK